MSAAALQPLESIRTAVLLIGPESLERTIRPLFTSSHWTLVRKASLEQALQLIQTENMPVVLCDDAEVQRIEADVARLDPAPVLISLSTNDGLDAGIHARGRSAFLVNAHRITAGEWFSLLNHAWRTTRERASL